jgi:AAHS family benzoate transporter-like MFS transporter
VQVSLSLSKQKRGRKMATGASTNSSGTAINVNKWLAGARFNGFHLRVFLLGLGIFTLDGYDLVIYGAAVPLLMKAFRMGPAQTGAIAGYTLMGAAIGSLLFGALADKIGRKTTILFCACLFSICSGLTGFTHSPSTFGMCRFIMGLGVGGSFPNMIALASEYAPSRNRTLMGGGIAGGMLVGGIAAALFAMWLFPHFGWRSVFFVGLIPLVFMPVYGKLLPESPDHLLKRARLEPLRAFMRKARPADFLPDDVALDVTQGSGKAPLAAVFQDGRAFSSVVIWIMFFMNMFVIWGFTVWLPKLMMNAGYSLGSGLFFLLTLQVISLFGGGIFPIIGDHIGARPALVIAFLLAFTCIVLVPYTHNFVLLLLLVGMSGFGFNGGQGIANGYVGSYYPPAMRSTGIGYTYAVGRLGSMAGPTLMGILMSLHLSYQTNMLILAAPGIVAAICILLVRDKYNFGRQQQESQLRAAGAHA